MKTYIVVILLSLSGMTGLGCSAGDTGDGEPSLAGDAPTEAEDTGNTEQALGKFCEATCSVVAVSAESCPASIGGYGETTFLGGCKKACRKARGDAASKLPAGCVINLCNTSGC